MVHGGGSRGGGGGSRSAAGGNSRNTVRVNTTTTTTTSSSNTSRRGGGGTRTATSSSTHSSTTSGGGSRSTTSFTSSGVAPSSSRRGAGSRSTITATTTSTTGGNNTSRRGGGGTRTTTDTTSGGGSRGSGAMSSGFAPSSTRRSGGSRSTPTTNPPVGNTGRSTRGGGTRETTSWSAARGTHRSGGGTRSNHFRNIRPARNPFWSTSHSPRHNHGGEDNNLEEPFLIRPSRELEDDDSTGCCHGCACLCCMTALGCLGCCCSPCLMALKAYTGKSMVPALCASLLLLGILMGMSGYRTVWDLNAGESRQVLSSWLTRAVDIQVITPHTAVEVDVYAVPGGCPPLTGPRVSIYHELDMTFGSGDYQYDSFYLNRGSRVDAGLFQLEGTADVYLLKGPDKVATLQQSHEDDDWLDNLLQSARMAWTVKDFSSQQTLARFRAADKSDTYTLVYDNPYRSSGHLLVDLWLDLTTYNLKGYRPICEDLGFHYCAPIAMDHNTCVLVETSASDGSVEEVSLRIVEQRDYSFILLISLVPTVLAILWHFWKCLTATPRSWQREPEDTTDPSLPARDPPTAPISSAPLQPSAPPASQDAAVIPIASAQLVDENAAASVEPVVVPVPASANEKI